MDAQQADQIATPHHIDRPLLPAVVGRLSATSRLQHLNNNPVVLLARPEDLTAAPSGGRGKRWAGRDRDATMKPGSAEMRAAALQLFRDCLRVRVLIDVCMCGLIGWWALTGSRARIDRLTHASSQPAASH